MPEKQYSKLDANTLRITKVVPSPAPAVSTYTYDDLIAMRDKLVYDKDVFNTDIDSKIDEAQELVDAAENLGIKPVEVVDEMAGLSTEEKRGEE